MAKIDILIIGGGPAGIVASHVAKKNNSKLKILIVKKEKGIAIRCSEPYVIGGKVKLEDIIVPDEEMINKFGIDLIIDEVIEIDHQNKKAYTESKEEISYNKLILATGANPFIPPVENTDLKNVFTLRDTQDTENISNIAKQSLKALVVGGGAIGIEVASLLKEKGLEVTVVEFMSHLVSGTYDEDFSKKVEKTLVDQGINLILKESVKSFIGKDKVEKAITSSGKEIETDLVIISCGVRSEVKLAQEIGAKIGKFGIEVNKKMETSIKNVYACGDCAQALSAITQKPCPSQLATTAVIQGKIAGINAAGGDKQYQGVTNPAVSVVFDTACGCVGVTEKLAQEENIDILVGKANSFTRYTCHPGKKPISLKLIFDKENEQIIGAQIFGGEEGISGRVNLLSLAIQKKLTKKDLAELHHCAHPELTPLPFAEPIVMAAESAK